jgi:hypothetical protein
MSDHQSRMDALEERLKQLEGDVHHLAGALKDGLEQFGHFASEKVHDLHIVSGAKEAAERVAHRLNPHHDQAAADAGGEAGTEAGEEE